MAWTATAFPVGWQGWKLDAVPGPSFNVNPPVKDTVLNASSTAATNTGACHNYDGKIGFLTIGTKDFGIVFSITTTGQSNNPISYDVMTVRNPYNGTTNTKINEVTLQYRVGTSGTFANITGSEYQNDTTNHTTADTNRQNPVTKSFMLPSACDNQPEVQLRWVAREVSGGGARPSFAFDNVSVTGGSGPSISVAPTALAFDTVALTDTSAEMSYTVSGANLTAGVTVTAPSADFRVTTTSGSGYTNTLVIPQAGGIVSPTTVYVIFKPTGTEGARSGNITNASAGATARNVAVSGTGSRIIVTGGPLNFGGAVSGGYSTEQSYAVFGRDLTEDITIVAPPQFEVSLTSGSGFGSSALLLIDGDSVAHTTVYARFAPTATGYRTDSVRHTSLGAANRFLEVSGRGVAAEPTVAAGNITFSSVTATGLTVGWTRGNGDSCLVLARCEGPVSAVPWDGYYYVASDSFGKGTQIGSGNYVVYKGSGTLVAVKKLYGITTYHFSVFEYNGGDSVENYLTTGAPSAFCRTAPANGVIPLAALGTGYTQDFNTLDTATQYLPAGWHFRKEGVQANYRYAADSGGLTTGNVYSYGTSGAVDRAYGMLQTGNLVPTISAAFVNNTGAVIPSLDIAYSGELWRLGARSRFDTLKAELSTTTGSWISYPGLNVTTPDTAGAPGRRDGNSPFYRTAVWYDIAGANIPAGDTFLVRWSDANASGSDDGMGIDDLTLTPFSGTGIPRIVSTSPADTARNVSTGAPVTIAFSERMRPASLAYTCAPDPGGWSAAWSANCDTVTLSHAGFRYYTAYAFAVTAARDSDENLGLAPGSKPNPISFTTQIDPAAPPMSITCLDVGQANCTIIRSPTGKRVMIDCYSHKFTGSSHSAQDSLLISNFIKDSLGTPNTPYLDDLFLTHWDHDHTGYVDVVIRHLDSLNGNAYDRGPLDTTDADFVAYKTALADRGWWGKRVMGRIGAKQTLDIGNGASIQVVCVRCTTILGDYLTNSINENNSSLGVLITYGNFKMCQTGDIESQMENILAGDFDSVDVMMVNHHGSAYSSTQTWVNALNPQASIISVGDSNSFGHPDSGATRRLTNDPGLNNFLYLTERGDTTKPLPARSRVCHRNIHIGVDVSNHSYTVDGDAYDLSPMGVSTADLSATAGTAGVTLLWLTQREADCCQWRIERSVNGESGYAAIGTVPGHGTTSEPHQYAFLDNTLTQAGWYWYRLAEVDRHGGITYHGPVQAIFNALGIAAFSSGMAYPNPARGPVSIGYQLPLPGRVTLGVYNIAGQLVRTLVDGQQPADHYQIRWDGRTAAGRQAASGIYLFRLVYQDGCGALGEQTAVKKLVLVR